MAKEIKRPGGEMAARPLHFFWICDCSGSMQGEKINTLNFAIRESLPDMKSAASDNVNARLLIRVVKFSNGAQWHLATQTPIEDFKWGDLEAEGLTDLGQALDLVSNELEIPPMPERALPPVLVLLSDGLPTDDYKSSLERLHNLPWGQKAVKIAIAIGNNVDMSVLERFTKNKELILKATNPKDLVKLIKWASTIAKQVSAPSSKAAESSKTTISNIELNSIPTVSDDVTNDVW